LWRPAEREGQRLDIVPGQVPAQAATVTFLRTYCLTDTCFQQDSLPLILLPTEIPKGGESP